jgi:uncharacterized protein (DUF169 family)
MNDKMRDYSIFDRFNFEIKPVGVRYSLRKPEGIKPLDKSVALCELSQEAQAGPFYASRETIQCGEHVVGFESFPPIMYSGQLGREFSMFKNPAANRRVYDYVPIMARDSVEYITCAPVPQMTYDPDVLIIAANTTQAEIILRASSYANGKMWSSRGSTCLACAWLYAYPYLSGELNYTVSGLGFSMKARGVLPEGLIIIAIPGDLLGTIMENLEDMEWHPHWFNLGREGFIKGVRELDERMRREILND